MCYDPYIYVTLTSILLCTRDIVYSEVLLKLTYLQLNKMADKEFVINYHGAGMIALGSYKEYLSIKRELVTLSNKVLFVSTSYDSLIFTCLFLLCI